MSREKKLSLQKEVKREAVKIEREVENNGKLKGIEVSKAMERALFAKIQEYKKKHENTRCGKKGDCEVSEKLSVDFTQHGSEPPKSFLSEEDQVALKLGRELIKCKNRGEALHGVNKAFHHHLNESNGEKKEGKVFRISPYKRLAVSAAVVVLLVAGIGVTTVGSKSYLKEFWNRVVGNEKISITNVQDMDTQKTDDEKEINIYKDIGEKLGILSVRLIYKPKDMQFSNASIDEEQKQAQLFYNYKDSIIRYGVYLNDSDSSLGERITDNLLESFEVYSDSQVIQVNSYEVEHQKNPRYVATFQHEGVTYQLKGAMEKEEFKKILENLAYF